MLPIATKVREVRGLDPRALPDDLLASPEPLLLRGLVREWPLVRAGLQSPRAAIDYLRRFARTEAQVAVLVAPPQVAGRYFYNDALTGFNFRTERPPLGAMLDAMERHLDDAQPPSLYMGSTTVDTYLPGLREENDLDLSTRDPLFSVWVGNRTRIAAHQDVPDNIACVAVGHRRFTVFPPDQLRNLYIGPLDLTPAGQPVSLVDFAAPDPARFPRFAEALAHAQVAELEPGDAIFIPSLWWHHVEGLDSFNVLLNYWWRRTPAYMDSPMNALMLALMSVRDLPAEQRAAWQEIFRHYVFEPDADTAGHIPESARRTLAPMTPEVARELRARLLQRLNR
ncbi:cupin-like domain-containing protein [Stenotrophomonas sp. HITSZ_GD]|uniref:cupin-like domain-containing protein n=1 Tax=Stenotrophomonas sp. HITSZ_GD TaxID=3037248 RepID=UPI00240D5ADB|nr:cupin-like domain-containing protein [Stenotrophomonas sp. HITSZ_GD]MDG2524170.1 cupin-like domain-containing protein [Stenotrophomonas sp. HITSZ_GD]